MPGANVLPPLPPPLTASRSPLHRMRALLGWGFGVSIALHTILGPIVGTYKPPIADAPEISMVSLSKRTTIKVPTPVPTPQPTKPPTPLPDRTPPPSPVAAPIPALTARPQARLKIDVLKSTSNAKSPTEPRYQVKKGSQAGVPQGTLASTPPNTGGAAPGQATPLDDDTPAARSAKANCVAPNVPATTSRTAQPEYPESARELGVTGEVEVLVSLSAAGILTAAVINHSSGNPALDEAAMRAARNSSYLPEVVACQPVAGTYSFHASFTSIDSK